MDHSKDVDAAWEMIVLAGEASKMARRLGFKGGYAYIKPFYA